jgi:hypothetical protein
VPRAELNERLYEYCAGYELPWKSKLGTVAVAGAFGAALAVRTQ